MKGLPVSHDSELSNPSSRGLRCNWFLIENTGLGVGRRSDILFGKKIYWQYDDRV